jgi:hut operon positive regulator
MKAIGARIMNNLLVKASVSEQLLPLPAGMKVVYGKVGTVKISDVIGSIQTAARREGLFKELYREEHILYSAISDALQGVCRGNIMLQELFRSAYLDFAVARGRYFEDDPGDWIIVALYGRIGSPIRGHDHEAMGFGVKPI